jgi:Flp pilus assembly protein TadD
VRRLASLVLVLAGLAAYADSLGGPFTYDDAGSILENRSIRHLGDLGAVLRPPASGGQTVGGRPFLNLSLAVNYALSGTAVWSYHLGNVLIHLGAGLLLAAILRRTLERAGRPPVAAAVLGGLVALLWTVHPLQTEAVTYTIQRAESLMGLCYLLTLYSFLRYAETPAAAPGRRAGWAMAAVAACAAGMATKEVMVSAPLIVLLYDRTFLAGSFRGAWAARRGCHLALAATWLLLGALMLGTHNRGGSIGFGNGVPWWAYALTQFLALVRYLWLSVWPHPLVFDYGTFWIHGAGEVLPAAAVILLLLGLTVAAVCGRRHRALGFLGAWFFLILAPTSSLVPGTTQMIVEHRMYLPLAAVLTLLVLGLAAAIERGRGRVLLGGGIVFLPVAAAYGALTFRRNAVYGSDLLLWRDTVAQRPEAARPHGYLGAVLLKRGDTSGAWAEYQTAARIDPDYPQAHNGLGTLLLRAGRTGEAIAEYRRAVAAAPRYAEAQYNLGLALLAAGQAEEAVAHERAALAGRPDYPDALNTLGNALFKLGQPAAAAASFGQAVALEPADAASRNNFGIALAHAGRLQEAVAQLEEAVRLRPGDAAIRESLARVQAAREAGGP